LSRRRSRGAVRLPTATRRRAPEPFGSKGEQDEDRRELGRRPGEPTVKIDIDALTEAELIDLNNRVVERLRFLNQMRAHGQMLQFKIGD
jgi:hypothetical protein